MTKEIDWNVIEITEIYEAFDMVLRLRTYCERIERTYAIKNKTQRP